MLIENGHLHKPISYLKLDIESTELQLYKLWLKRGVLRNVQQLGIEWHTGQTYIEKSEMKRVYKGLIKFCQKLNEEYGLQLASYNPNLCQGKKSDARKTYYTVFDVLFTKKSN